MNILIVGNGSIGKQHVSALLSLGLKPIEFDSNQIENIFKIVKANLDRVNQDTLDPNIKWKY